MRLGAEGKAMARLLVFLHLMMKQRALQAELQAALSALTITAVGRVADFDRALAQGRMLF